MTLATSSTYTQRQSQQASATVQTPEPKTEGSPRNSVENSQQPLHPTSGPTQPVKTLKKELSRNLSGRLFDKVGHGQRDGVYSRDSKFAQNSL